MARRRPGREGSQAQRGKGCEGKPRDCELAGVPQAKSLQPEQSEEWDEPKSRRETCETVSTRTSSRSSTQTSCSSPALPLSPEDAAAAVSAASSSSESPDFPALPIADASSRSEAEPPLPCIPERAEAARPEAARVPAFSPSETLLILDWDDTCLPSSWITAHMLRLDSDVPHECAQQLQELAPRVHDFLAFCKTRGDVLLITNAERGWVERSCEKFLPSVVPDLEGLRVFSARSAFEQEGVFAPLEWKRRAFASAIKEAQDAAALPLRNVLSLGDSPHERDALFTARDVLFRADAGAGAPRWRSKSVKFMERPDACQLLREHILVLQFFDQVLDHDGDLDLCIKCC